MLKNNHKEKIDRLKEILWFGSVISIPLSTIIMFIFFGIWSVYGDSIIKEARDKLGIDRNHVLITQALGEDRVFRQPRGLTYVKEPVYYGDDVIVNITLEVTSFGETCVFVEGNASYIKPNGIQIGGIGNNEVPIIKRATEKLTRYQLIARGPDKRFIHSSEIDQRWAIYFIFQYDCQGKMMFEETTPSDFILRSQESKQNRTSF